jgi:hypothetical protein
VHLSRVDVDRVECRRDASVVRTRNEEQVSRARQSERVEGQEFLPETSDEDGCVAARRNRPAQAADVLIHASDTRARDRVPRVEHWRPVEAAYRGKRGLFGFFLTRARMRAITEKTVFAGVDIAQGKLTPT